MEVRYEHNNEKNYTLIQLRGRFDSFNSPLLNETFLDLHKNSRYIFALDLSGVEFINSTTLGLLLEIYRKNRENKGNLFLVSCSDKVMKILQITRLDKVFKIFDSLSSFEKGLVSHINPE